MAAQIQAAQHFRNVQIFKTQSLGLGSYGAVFRAKADRLPCAAKLLHPILFQDRDPGARRIQQRFEQECQFLSGIRHPNIVQYLGTCRDHESGFPALLMELMDESLTHFLENSQEPLPYHLEVNLSHDTALALDYLHTHGIVHRDLSSNNVLLIAGSRAKVTDFGMSKLLDTTLHMTPQTQCPGTMAYMSPEALRIPPVYTKKLDCFSFGVLAIQITTRQFPDPGPAKQVVEDPRSPVGTIEMPVLERERRKRHIYLITPNPPLLLTALRSLEYHERNRPSAQELCDQLATLKEDPQYTQSVQQAQERGRGGTSATADVAHLAQLQRSLAVRDCGIQYLQEQLQEKDATTAANQQEIQQLQQESEEKTHIIEARDRQLRDLNQQLQTNEQVTAELQQKEGRIRDLQEIISAKDEQLQEQQMPNFTALEWRQNKPAPDSMSRGDGSVTEDGNVVYCRSGKKMYAYSSQMDNWTNLPDCPNTSSTLALVNGLLTAVGGSKSGTPTNALVSLTGTESERKWSEHFPPMPTKRSCPAVVCSGRSLVAAGGKGEMRLLSTVEVMGTDVLQWFTASGLPHLFFNASVTVIGDNLYLLGGLDEYGRTKSVLTCSLTALLQSCQPQSLGGRLNTLTLAEDPRHRVADVPVYMSPCTTLCGQLLAVGGWNNPYDRSDAVYKYDPTKNTWNIISHIPSFPFGASPLVAPLPGNKLVVCCGQSVYTASIVQH